MVKKKAKKKTGKKVKHGRPALLTRDNDPGGQDDDYELRECDNPPRWIARPNSAYGYWLSEPNLTEQYSAKEFHRKYPHMKLPPGGGPVKVRITIERDE